MARRMAASRCTALVAFVLATIASSCGPRVDPLAGTYLVRGGGAPLEVFTALSQEFAKWHPGVNFQFDDVGSTPGMRLVADGTADLGTSSAPVAPDLKGQVELLPVGVSGTS